MDANRFDVLIVGAGAAGMMCALTAAQRGRSVLLLDHSSKLAEKIRISGGGRCNFTNLNSRPENFLSQNPHFCRSALARFTPQHFIAMLERHGIGYHEKTLGQLFCDDGSEAIIAMLKSECDAAGVRWCMPCGVEKIERDDEFVVTASHGKYRAESLVIATGGLSIPKIGATPFGYKLAEQFGVPMTRLKPGLVPLTFHPEEWAAYAELSGASLDAVVSFGKHSFRENLLFTHRGLSGPAILQISSYWEQGMPLSIDLLPDLDAHEMFLQQRGSKMLLGNFLAQYLPKRLAEIIAVQWLENKPLNQYAEKELRTLADKLKKWQIIPSGTMGYGKAEVTCGGVDTRALSSKTMECNNVPGLYFVGEVMDVTGQLGGYNFQWAWASGYAAGQAA
ncbi:NAD(P)/FAD-dependent oxidoreductase [Sideroxydans lithotrophicus]|uniref:HI0933 family protein n=1 Tax=Sideroxydans lithotrophicus (strain ES-1) TaxID=580332 RepID=D5CS14_SIDLE|nr:NAD(P)/FAD-dependent oxidoreductase [Sideroxydans lithotrophicus]ADE11750.1 HI0933 family protein [Sideroxydans lithotrophicus ES-1]